MNLRRGCQAYFRRIDYVWKAVYSLSSGKDATFIQKGNSAGCTFAPRQQFMRNLLTFVFIAISAVSFSQSSLFINRNIQQAYDHGTRSMDGKPGKNYWQNRADYDINVSFDPKSLLVSGEETITYYNNSPDTLRQLIIRLFPDYYKHGIQRNYPVDEKDENNGVVIDFMQVGNEVIADDKASGKAVRDQTNLFVTPGASIHPFTRRVLKVRWHYTLNSGSQNRTGQVDPHSFFIAYFFPRIAVYDDVDGWDDVSYKGVQEFYNDFGNFNVSISVPKGYVVWATGDLQNEMEVLAPDILSRFHEAHKSDRVIHVIDSNDYRKGMVTAANAINLWKFSAINVTDFVFALSDHYLWDACSVVADKNSGRKVLVQTAYNRDHKDYFDVINLAKRCVQITSDTFPAVPFPFSHETIFDGTDQMEYPMMVNDNPTETRADAVQLTSHEIFHAYFPFFVGTNETQYAWMDEGWATMGESVISPMLGEPEAEGVYRKGKFEKSAGTDQDVPMITSSELLSGPEYYNNSYGKAGACYWMLRDLLGEEKFLKALHAYIAAWNGKHPTPYDFFFIFNTTTGENLDWFWKPWFFDWGYPDLSIKSVDLKNGNVIITVENTGAYPLPVTLDITLKDGTLIHHHETARVWKAEKTVYIFQAPVNGEIEKVILGDIYTPDSFRKDNEWKK